MSKVKDVFSVAGKVTVVTGGGTGIGIAIAREFALREAPVLIASRNAGHLEPVRDEIRKLGGTCEMTVCDVRDAAAVDERFLGLKPALEDAVKDHSAL